MRYSTRYVAAVNRGQERTALHDLRSISPPPASNTEVNTRNDVLISTSVGAQNQSDATRRIWRASTPGTRLTLFSHDKPERFFIVVKFWMDETSGIALALRTGVPSYQVEDEEGRIHLLIHLPIEDREHRWCLWRPDQAGQIHF
jgi:hypothetical protein